MKDFYATLGLTKEASERDIKNAYRKLALIFHTDRGGDGEKIRLINEAYETLSDTEKKHHYDLDWQAYQDADPDARMAVVEIGGYLLRGPTPPYSRAFRAQHHSLVQQYKNAPLKKRLRETIVNFESSIYQVNNFILSTLTYHDIFSFLRAQANQSVERTFKFQDKLTPILAIKLFINFLAGDYYGSNLRALKQYLRTELKTIKSANKQASEVLLFEGISELVFMTNEEQVQGHALLSSLKKITDFSKKAPTELMPALAPLFYNKYFRNLHAYALHLHWHSSENLFDADYLKQFNGYEDARELLSTLKEKLGNNSGNKQLSKLIRYVKLLFNAEETVGKFNTPKSTASELRKGAFLYLDWIPVFMDKSSKEVLVNIFLQIGIRFQHASRLESQPALKMADERLAMKMYLTAGGIANHSTPDIEIYANTHIVKYLSDFKFEDETLTEVIPALKKRTLFISDVFPFFEKPQSTIAFLKQENQTLHLMRHLLNAMLTTLEYNKTHADGIAIDHSAATIFYEIYAACVNNWFKKEYDPALEKKFRLELMDELLFDNSWTFLDVEQLINSPWIMIDRDEDGWIKSSRSLPYADDEFIKYRTINGAEVNQKTGEINFFMTPWTKERPVSEKLFTLFDLQQMLEKNLSSAIFSLDPVDPDRPYHPFNALRFSPSQLCESELLNTMLLTDYILKFLTTNQEVQGQYPFDQRSVASMIQHLPAYLRKIIDDFHKAQHTGALHRFWIEAEELDVALSDEDITKQDITRIALGNLKMVVKKHRMERDIYGNLQDVGDEDEGWPIYVLTREQVEQVNSGQQVITGHAMIFIHAATELYYWENNEVIKAHRPENYRETLIRLYIQPRDSTGKVIQNTKNRPLLYRVTREMARQTGLSDRYSSEFIFAHLFTTHYDEFAQYLPEFGRLKELSKIATLIRVLDNMRQSNQESIEALDFLLNGSLSPVPDTSAYRHYYKIQQSIEKQITKSFDKWRKELSTSVLQKKWRNELNRIMSEIGPLTFSSDSTEVNEACKDWLNELSRQNPGISPFRIIREVINPKRAEIAEQLSKSKQASYRRQLSELFSAKLASIGHVTYSQLIDSLLQGNVNPLANALMNQEKIEAQNQINPQFPHSATHFIATALDDGGQATAQYIAAQESNHALMQQRELKAKLESGFAAIHLGKHQEETNLEGQCFWVPASIRHEVQKDDTTGLARYSFFVYGGVSVQPRVNVVAGRNGPLDGNRVSGGAFNRKEITRGFQSHHIISPTNKATKNHELLQLAGFNNKKDMNSQTNRIYLPDGRNSQHPNRSVHSGRHTQLAMDAVGDRMQKIVQTGKTQNWTQSQYRAELRKTLSELRQDLRNGKTNLYSKPQPKY